jgi:hypothetical protein
MTTKDKKTADNVIEIPHQEQTVNVNTVNIPIVAKKETVEKKPQWEIKDRHYYLTGNKSPLTYVIPTRHKINKPLLWFDPVTNEQREIRYATNMPSSLRDEQKGEATLGHVLFRNGHLFVPKEYQALQKLLSIYHPYLNKRYAEVDKTGSIVGRSFTQDGNMNPGKVPIQELQTSSGQSKIAALISTYQYYLQMIRDVTGLNEARDGSTPDKNALVGLQKLAAANSNTATRHILQAASYVTLRLCENISLKAKDIFEFALTESSLIESINEFNVNTLKEISDLHLHDFGIYLELEPDEEEKAQLQQNIQASLQAGAIYLDDVIDLQRINNIDLANKYLKLKRRKKQEADQAAQQANIQAQGQANAQASEAAALAELQKQQALTESKLQLEQGKNQLEITKLEREAEIKMRLMELEFQFNKQLVEAQAGAAKNKESYKEDRKDERTKIQATQQSELIDQRKNDSLPKNFESAGFDVLGGFGLGQFEPK